MHISKIFPALILGFLGLSDAHAADGFYIGASAGAYLREDSTFTVHAVGNPSITGLGSESYDPGAIVKWPGTQQGRSCAYCQSGAAILLLDTPAFRRWWEREPKQLPQACWRSFSDLSLTLRLI